MGSASGELCVDDFPFVFEKPDREKRESLYRYSVFEVLGEAERERVREKEREKEMGGMNESDFLRAMNAGAPTEGGVRVDRGIGIGINVGVDANPSDSSRTSSSRADMNSNLHSNSNLDPPGILRDPAVLRARKINTEIPHVLPHERVFPVQIGSELFRLSGASLSSDGMFFSFSPLS